MAAKVWPQYLGGMAACLGAISCGATLGWSAPVQAPIMAGAYGFKVSLIEFSWVGSIVTFGAGCACIPGGFLCKYIGRRITMIIMVVPFTAGWLMLIFAPNLWVLILSRFILGFSGGSLSVAAPMYATEIVETKRRGRFGNFFQLGLCIGILFAQAIGPVLKMAYYSGVCAIIPIIFGIIFIFMPESPVFYISKDKLDKAKKSMEFFRGKEYDSTAELNAMIALDKKIKEDNLTFCAALKGKKVRKGLFLGLPLHFIQQTSGIKAILFYSTVLFAKVSPDLNPHIATIIVGVALVVGTIISILIVDRAGRRPLLIASTASCTVFTGSMGVYLFFDSRHSGKLTGLGFLPVVFIVGYILVYSLGIGPCPWLVAVELFTPEVRGPCSALASMTNWYTGFLTTSTYGVISKTIGADVTFGIFALFAFLGCLFISFLLPETKGKTISEIQELL